MKWPNSSFPNSGDTLFVMPTKTGTQTSTLELDASVRWHDKLPTFLFILFVLLQIPNSVYAAACCTSATAFGVGRLLAWEKLALGISQSLEYEAGFFDRHGQHELAADDVSLIFPSRLWGIAAINDRISLFSQMPFYVTEGLGDILSGVRYQAVGIGEFSELPGISFMGTILVPTGLSPLDDSLDPQQSFTGRGVFVFGLATSLEKSFMPWFTQLNLGVAVPLPRNNYSYGIGLDTSIAVGREITQTLVASVLLLYSYESNQRFEGNLLPDTASFKTGAAIAASWRFSPHFTLQSSLISDLFIPYLTRNRPSSVTGLVGIRYGYF